MKILSATVGRTPDSGSDYVARAVVMDEGVQYTSDSFGPCPEGALKAAVANACNKAKAVLVLSVKVQLTPTF